MIDATLQLRDEIISGRIPKSQFNKNQLRDIFAGVEQVEGYTWHHNAQSGPNNIQLVPYKVHYEVKHIGQKALSEGR